MFIAAAFVSVGVGSKHPFRLDTISAMAARRRFGRYEVIRELGRGGMASVYLARDPQIGRNVAIKVMNSAFAADADFKRRFEREARAVAQLEHPAIVPLYDHGTHRGSLFIVFRYMEGGSLADRIRMHGPLAVDDVIAIARRLGSALDYAHGRGIIHRDLKPANVLFDADGEAWLADFGIAAFAEQTSSLTAGGWIGSPPYMSPEQASGAAVTPASDIYSLAVTVFEALTGRLPFASDSTLALLMKHLREPPPDVSRFRPGTPMAVSIAVTRAMAKMASARWPSATAFADALAGRTVEAATDPANPYIAERSYVTFAPTIAAKGLKMTGPGFRRRWQLGILGLLALVATGGGTVAAIAHLAGETMTANRAQAPGSGAADMPIEAPSATPGATLERCASTPPTQTPTLTSTPTPTPTATPTPTVIPPTATPTRSPVARSATTTRTLPPPPVPGGLPTARPTAETVQNEVLVTWSYCDVRSVRVNSDEYAVDGGCGGSFWHYFTCEVGDTVTLDVRYYDFWTLIAEESIELVCS